MQSSKNKISDEQILRIMWGADNRKYWHQIKKTIHLLNGGTGGSSDSASKTVIGWRFINVKIFFDCNQLKIKTAENLMVIRYK